MLRRALVRGLIIGTAPVAFACSLFVDTDGLEGSSSNPNTPANTSPEAGGESSPDGDVGGPDGSSGGPGRTPPPSCMAQGAGLSDCGPKSAEDCCTSNLVPGGLYKRGHDGVILIDPTHPAQISSFQLDRFEVTVGRFRRFVEAAAAGWRPAAGAGKHSHLNSGKGLAAVPEAAGQPFEPGWDASLSASLAGTVLDWTSRLSCHVSYQTWTLSAGAKERFPINCVSWPEAAAFCIWDGGFLPSETELAYAGAGGDEQRVYPWSNPPTSTAIDCTYLNISGCGDPPNSAPTVGGSRSPKGDGRWGHADLAGNLFEWAADVYVEPFVDPCIDCVVLSGASEHVAHGAGYFNPTSGAANGARYKYSDRDYVLGLRCARPL